MSQFFEMTMYEIGQIFLIPTLLVISILFIYSIQALGAFLVNWHQRRKHQLGSTNHNPRYFELIRWVAVHPNAKNDDWDIAAHKMLELPRIVSRVAPMMGLIATMIPMGPALRGLADGNIAIMASNLSVAFSSVIVALITASITFWIVSVRRRWLAEEIAWLQERQKSTAPALHKVAA